MKKAKVFLAALVLVGFGLGVFPLHSLPSAEARRLEAVGLEAQPLLDAALQILIFAGDGSYYDQGLGTIVDVNGRTLIVTHNHWTFQNFLKNFQKAQIRNLRDELLRELDRSEFLNLILFSDPGTLILQAPAGLNITPASPGDFQAVKVGDSVTITQQDASNPPQLRLLQAQVRAISSYHGCRAYYLVPGDGEKIMPGDSGGGVWLDGQFLGNIWGIFEEPGTLFRNSSRVTIAAQFPQSYLKILRDR